MQCEFLEKIDAFGSDSDVDSKADTAGDLTWMLKVCTHSLMLTLFLPRLPGLTVQILAHVPAGHVGGWSWILRDVEGRPMAGQTAVPYRTLSVTASSPYF